MYMLQTIKRSVTTGTHECVTQREFQLRFGIFFLTIDITFIMDRKKRLRYPHTPNEAAIDCKRRREEPCII